MSEHKYYYNIAPGEWSVPLSVFRDKYSEELAIQGYFSVKKGQRMTID